MSDLLYMEWGYYYLRKGTMVTEDGDKVFNHEFKFETLDEAEKWLRDNGERGNVIGFYEDLIKNKKKEKK